MRSGGVGGGEMGISESNVIREREVKKGDEKIGMHRITNN